MRRELAAAVEHVRPGPTPWGGSTPTGGDVLLAEDVPDRRVAVVRVGTEVRFLVGPPAARAADLARADMLPGFRDDPFPRRYVDGVHVGLAPPGCSVETAALPDATDWRRAPGGSYVVRTGRVVAGHPRRRGPVRGAGARGSGRADLPHRGGDARQPTVIFAAPAVGGGWWLHGSAGGSVGGGMSVRFHTARDPFAEDTVSAEYDRSGMLFVVGPPTARDVRVRAAGRRAGPAGRGRPLGRMT